jgi:hypothetical protein
VASRCRVMCIWISILGVRGARYSSGHTGAPGIWALMPEVRLPMDNVIAEIARGANPVLSNWATVLIPEIR